MDQRSITICRGGQGIDLFSHIVSIDNLYSAWREFSRGKKKKPDVAQFEFNLEDNIFQLHEDLISKTYEHSPYKSFYVRDPKLRHIHKACVRDRMVHQALFRVLYPIFDRHFIFDSYSCRFGKGTHAAVNRLHDLARKCSSNWRKNIFVLKCDIKKFFDSVDEDILSHLIQKRIGDENILWLVGEILDSFETEKGKGLPLGNVTSQLFANIYLNELDWFVKREFKEKCYIRYCDDFVILSQSITHLSEIVKEIDSFVRGRLGLCLHENKTEIRKYEQGTDFLGYIDFYHFRVLRTKTRRRMVKKIINGKFALSKGIVDAQSFESYFQSYAGILKHCNGYKLECLLNNLRNDLQMGKL